MGKRGSWRQHSWYEYKGDSQRTPKIFCTHANLHPWYIIKLRSPSAFAAFLGDLALAQIPKIVP